jgi:hypothetical protein
MIFSFMRWKKSRSAIKLHMNEHKTIYEWRQLERGSISFSGMCFEQKRKIKRHEGMKLDKSNGLERIPIEN